MIYSTRATGVDGPEPLLEPDRAGWFRALFESSNEAHLICRDSRIVEANRSALGLLGSAAKTGIPQLEEFLNPATQREMEHALKRKEGPAVTLLAVPIRHPGRPDLESDLQVLPLGGGCHFLTLKCDDRSRRIESHVRRLVTAIDATPDVFFLTDAEFRLTFVNPAFQIATGHTIEEALARSADFLRAPGQAGKIQDYLECVLRGRDWKGELINVRSDGSHYPVEATISPIHDSRGGFLGFVSCERDITATKQLRAELLQERDYARSMINSLDSAIYTVDREFRLTHINGGWKKFPAEHGSLIMNQSPETGRILLDYVADPDKRRELAGEFQTVISGRQSREFRTSSPDGRAWMVKISPYEHGGKVMGLIYQVTDHTQLQQLQSQLFQAQKMETIGALAAGVAHDFNNLLMAIRGNASLVLLEDGLEGDIRQRLQQIDQAAERAAVITRQLLSFSRDADERITVLDFNEVIREAGEMARRLLGNNVQLRLEPSVLSVPVQMDSTRAQQLLLNLCVNAQDAMPDGGVLTITNQKVSLTPPQSDRLRIPAATVFVKCSVADTGTGIPPEVMPRIFDPFFTTKEMGKGTGLGLAIASSAIAQAGGFMEVETKMGQGTVFHIYLPEARLNVTSTRQERTNRLHQGTGCILLVDDLDLVLDFTRKFLGAAGYTVLTANCSEAALEILEHTSQPIDLLLTDYNMPGQDGWHLIQEAAARWPHLKFILSTGHVEPEEMQQIEASHGTRVLHKPFNLAEAATLIAEMLGQKPSSS